MRVIWKFVITFEKMNTMETILFHVSKVFYKGMLKKKKSNFEGTIVLEVLSCDSVRWRPRLGRLRVAMGRAMPLIQVPYVQKSSNSMIYFLLC